MIAPVLVAAALAAPPVIDTVEPAPLTLGGAAQVVGEGFETGQTSVTIGGVTQPVLSVTGEQIVLTVAPITLLGPADLVVTTPSGQATEPVMVAPAPPQIVSVSPDPAVLGELITVKGTALDTAGEVRLGDASLTVTEQTEAVIVAEVPLSPALLGSGTLIVTGSSGSDTATLTVVAPAPTIDVVTPNPIRQGDLLTVGGALLGGAVTVTIGGVAVPTVLTGEDGGVTAFVGGDVAPGAHDVVATISGQASVPVGPLHVSAGDPGRPEVIAWWPAVVRPGGVVQVAGQGMDEVEDVVNGVLIGCAAKTCRVQAPEAAPGTVTVVLTGAAGGAAFSLPVGPAHEAPAPVVEAVSPSPIYRGDTLTLTGTGLLDAGSVVIGAVDQPIDYQDATTIRVTVAEDTPLGAEALFVATTTASEPVMVTVLEAFEVAEPEAEPAPAPEVEPSPEPEPAPAAEPEEVSSPDDEAPPPSSGGCTAGGGSPSGALSLLVLLAIFGLARRRRV